MMSSLFCVIPIEFTSNLVHHNVKLNWLHFFFQRFWNTYAFAELLLISILNTVMPAIVTQVKEVSETLLL